MQGWLIAGTVATAGATILVAVFSYFLWRANERLASNQEKLTAIQFNADRRNDAILKYRQIRLTDAAGRAEKGVLFSIWNSGLKDTHIRGAFLRFTGPDGIDDRTELKFWWHKRDYQGHAMGNDLYTAPVPFHFIGETLKSGQLWEVEAQPVEDRGVRSYQNPRIVVEPVLGHPFEMAVEDPLKQATKDGIERLRVGEAPRP